jgi:hypothetical protein
MDAFQIVIPFNLLNTCSILASQPAATRMFNIAGNW